MFKFIKYSYNTHVAHELANSILRTGALSLSLSPIPIDDTLHTHTHTHTHNIENEKSFSIFLQYIIQFVPFSDMLTFFLLRQVTESYSLLVKCQNDNFPPGAVTGGSKFQYPG